MKGITCIDYTINKTKRKLMKKMINRLEEKDKEIDRLNNIINELEKYIVNEIDNANEELNVIMKGDDLEYINECSKEFNCIKKFVDKTLDKLQKLKEGK